MCSGAAGTERGGASRKRHSARVWRASRIGRSVGSQAAHAHARREWCPAAALEAFEAHQRGRTEAAAQPRPRALTAGLRAAAQGRPGAGAFSRGRERRRAEACRPARRRARRPLIGRTSGVSHSETPSPRLACARLAALQEVLS